jgi:hypothetical protein
VTRRKDDKAWRVQHDKHEKVPVFIFGSK